MNIAVYLRISRADDEIDEKNESNSIDNQRLLILDYISQHEELLGNVTEYIDDGYTGTNFNRPGFQNMLADARAGKLDAIIAKDLSRLGRDYIEMGDYIEQIFPALGVRVIAINSHYDSINNFGNIAGLDVAISNFINSMYSRDLSMKRKSADRSRWAVGKSSEKSVPFGYIRKNKTKEWKIDEPAAEVVKFIFEKAAKGWTTMMIVNELNKNRLDPPGLYKEKNINYNYNFVVADHENIWDIQKVRIIIRRYDYTGTLVVHKSETLTYAIGKSKPVPKDDWIYIENHHPAIISKELYEKAQEAIKTVEQTDDDKINKFSLKSKLRCGNCRLMFAYTEYKGNERCYCAHKAMAGKYCTCLGKVFPYKKIEKSVYNYLVKSIDDIKMLDSILNDTIDKEKPENIQSLSSSEKQVEILKTDLVLLYERYASGVISAIEYKAEKNRINAELDRLNEIIAFLKNKMEQDKVLAQEIALKKQIAEEVLQGDKLAKDGTAKDQLAEELSMEDQIAKEDSIENLLPENNMEKDSLTEDKLTKKMVDLFIKNVYVHDLDRLEIVFTYDDLTSKIFMRSNEVMQKYFAQ